MKVLSGVYWSAGMKKQSNQDSLAVQQVATPQGRVCLVVVCDGIGGLPAGEVASGYVSERISRWFYEEGVSLIIRKKGKEKIKRSILRIFFQIWEDLQKFAVRNNINLGTTVTLLLTWKNKYLVFHLGDSRLYLCRRSVKQLTADHSNEKGALTRCMNSYFWQPPDIFQGQILHNSGFLLCTDGFCNQITVRQLAEVFCPQEIREEKQIESRLREVAEYVMKRGEKDNISAVFIKF